MSTLTLEYGALRDQLVEELKLIEVGESVEMGLSNWLGNDGRYCTLTKECMPSCN